MTNYEKIKAMSVAELAAFLHNILDDDASCEVACYGCINYGTHHADPNNKGTYLYECEDCSCEGIGLDLVKWLESECEHDR